MACPSLTSKVNLGRVVCGGEGVARLAVHLWMLSDDEGCKDLKTEDLLTELVNITIFPILSQLASCWVTVFLRAYLASPGSDEGGLSVYPSPRRLPNLSTYNLTSLLMTRHFHRFGLKEPQKEGTNNTRFRRRSQAPISAT